MNVITPENSENEQASFFEKNTDVIFMASKKTNVKYIKRSI